MKTILRLASCAALLVACACPASADVIVSVAPPFSDPPFLISPGYSVSYAPADSIQLVVPSGFPQPNTDVMNDNMFGVSPNYGGTGYTALTSRHVFENSPEVELTIGGLTDSQPYEVSVLTFINADTDFYGGRYGFTSGNLTTYFASSGGTILATGVDGPDGQGQFQIREFDLGTQFSTAGSLSFYFDDFDGASLVGDFVGLRLEPVPEPSSIALALIGAIAMAYVSCGKRLQAACNGD